MVVGGSSFISHDIIALAPIKDTGLGILNRNEQEFKVYAISPLILSNSFLNTKIYSLLFIKEELQKIMN